MFRGLIDEQARGFFEPGNGGDQRNGTVCVFGAVLTQVDAGDTGDVHATVKVDVHDFGSCRLMGFSTVSNWETPEIVFINTPLELLRASNSDQTNFQSPQYQLRRPRGRYARTPRGPCQKGSQ